MFSIVMSLEESNSQSQFEDYTSNGPNVARLRPTQLHNYLWGSVVSRRDYC